MTKSNSIAPNHRRPALGVRGVAMFEAAKGALVILAGCGLLSLVHHDVQRVIEQIIARLHLNPARHTAQIFIEAAAHVDDARLRQLAMLALLYAIVRLVEAYGLWFGRRWAEWFAVLSGAFYLPLELLELSRGITGLKFAALAINLIVVIYLISIMVKRNREEGRGAVA